MKKKNLLQGRTEKRPSYKKRTIRSIFFYTFSGIALISIIGVSVLYAIIQAPKIKAQSIAALTQATESISASMDAELTRMSTVAMNIAYSTQVSDSFAGISSYSKAEEARRILSLLTMQLFPGRPVDQIDLYRMDGIAISSGLHNEVYEAKAEETAWYSLVNESSKNQAHLFTGRDPKISKYYTDEYGKCFVSFAMRIYNTFNLPYGYLEIRQRLNRVVGAAIDYTSIYGEKIYIFDQYGTQMFPLNEDASALFSSAQELGFPSSISKYSGFDGDDRLICSLCGDGSFQVIMSFRNYALAQPVRSFLLSTFLVAALALLFALMASFYSARDITVPLNSFCQKLEQINATQNAPLEYTSSDIEEIQTLYRVFSQMQQTLHKSTTRQILLEKQEMQSRMLALQSQMNPHLLYNSLATIQAMSDEGMNAEIGIMCQSISSILRYIASNAEQEVSLETEIRHTRDYIQCMVFRYQENLTFSIHIPEQMNEIRIPKLCIQLLVENAIKYASLKRPPYFISITGKLLDNAYEIAICDNGPGFSKDALQTLEEQIANINHTGFLPSLEINGMGIMNIYIRFRLLYGENTIFRLENLEGGGACVTMGVKKNG